MAKWKKKPVVVEAFLWTGREDQIEDPEWIVQALKKGFVRGQPGGARIISGSGDCHLEIVTLEGVMRAEPGDYIIRGIKGEIYPCKPDIFLATYEPA